MLTFLITELIGYGIFQPRRSDCAGEGRSRYPYSTWVPVPKDCDLCIRLAAGLCELAATQLSAATAAEQPGPLLRHG